MDLIQMSVKKQQQNQDVRESVTLLNLTVFICIFYTWLTFANTEICILVSDEHAMQTGIPAVSSSSLRIPYHRLYFVPLSVSDTGNKNRTSSVI